MIGRAQERAALPRIVLLSYSEAYQYTRGFEESLRTLGYTNGVTIAIDYRSAEGRDERLPALAREAIALGPRVIVAIGSKAAIATAQATKDVPIVTVAGDIVAAGLVKNLARPEGNITGLSFFMTELMLKRFEIMMELSPNLRRLAVLGVARPSPATESGVATLRGVAHKSGVDLQDVNVERIEDVKPALAKLRQAGVKGLLVWPTPILDARATDVGRLTAEQRLIAVLPFKEYVQGGGLVAYGPDLEALIRRTSTYVDRILRGAKAGDLPIEQPTKFELVVNLKTAKTLGLAIPPGLLLRADHVLQ